MRAIKFIGRATATGEWVYGNLVTREEREATMTLISSQDASDKSCLVDPETVGQYTGYNDMCRREIYEGDKLRLRSDIIGYVCWSSQGWVVITHNPSSEVSLVRAIMAGVWLVDDRDQ